MLARKVAEVIFKNLYSILHCRGLLAMSDLQKEAFAQVTRSHSDRLELLDDLEHLEDLVLIRLKVCPERHVVDNTVYASSQITVVIQASYNKSGDSILMLSKITVTQLLHEALGEAFLYGKRVILGTLVLRIIVRPEAIAWDGIILLIFGEGDLSRSLITILILCRILIQHRILLQFLPDPLLKLLDRKLDQLDGLDLQRGELLGLL